MSAIRAPQPSDPKDYYLDAEAAWAKLGEDGEPPEALSLEEERARLARLEAGGVSWTDAAGRNFSKEFWNPLVGFWVKSAGWDFVFDVVFPDADELVRRPGSGEWFAIRRYLSCATDEEYETARARCAPIFERIRDTEEWDEEMLRDGMAYAFLRDPWADELLRGYLERKRGAPNIDMLVAATTDTGLAVDAVKRFGRLRDVYYVFDMVESHGRGAVELLSRIETSGAPKKKRVAQALAIAEGL